MTSRNFVPYPSTDELVSKVHPTPDTPCHSTPCDESRRQRHKSVTFSLVTQVVSVLDMKESSSTTETTLSRSMFGDSTNASHNVNGPTERPSKKDYVPLDNPPSSRKRRFSLVSPPQVQLHIPSSNEVAASDESPSPSSPRKRRLSNPLSYEDVSVQPKSGVMKALGPNSPRHTNISTLAPPTIQPPPEICEEVNHRIRTTFDHPSFDFSQHVLHRTYVVRSIAFSPSEECVSMLDIGVDALFPSVFPHPPVCVDDNFTIHPSAGKGLGMFSRRSIRSGDIVLVERPVILTPYVIGLAVPLAQLYSDMFEKLSPDVSKQLMELSSSARSSPDKLKRSQVEFKTTDICESIMRMNALAVQLQVPKGEYAELSTHRGVFLQTSRCNHRFGPLVHSHSSTFLTEPHTAAPPMPNGTGTKRRSPSCSPLSAPSSPARRSPSPMFPRTSLRTSGNRNYACCIRSSACVPSVRSPLKPFGGAIWRGRDWRRSGTATRHRASLRSRSGARIVMGCLGIGCCWICIYGLWRLSKMKGWRYWIVRARFFHLPLLSQAYHRPRRLFPHSRYRLSTRGATSVDTLMRLPCVMGHWRM